MSYKPPTPPANLPTEIVNTLNESDPELLRDVATYAEALTEHKGREARLRTLVPVSKRLLSIREFRLDVVEGKSASN